MLSFEDVESIVGCALPPSAFPWSSEASPFIGECEPDYTLQ